MHEASAPPAPPIPSDDDAHLRALSICWYVVSGLSALCGCAMGAILIGFSTLFTKAIESVPVAPGQQPPPREFIDLFGWMYGGMGVLYLGLGLGSALLSFLTARWLAARRNRVFCFVSAAIACLSVPIGTALGVFTIIVLSRPSVQQAFDRNRRG
jgi:hypothetical protein